ncbi:hypothetical protein [Pacificimonas flava]|uniref:hypothetical protein n=1 Tax=Pacificimonas flava TaxID=1234595 RepID=UPI0004BC3C2F|nr:hypothetical protein [Pacificimonas flava]MBB5279556.1 hypothetical protein [Pacificimonas flava]
MKNALIAIAALLATGLNVGVAVGPAHAAEPSVCETMPQDIRAAAANADANDANRALRKVDIGVRLCDAGNERAASKQFDRALKVLDLTPTELAQR